MVKRKEHLNIELEFLNEKKTLNTVPNKVTDQPLRQSTAPKSEDHRTSWKALILVIGIFTFFLWGMFKQVADYSATGKGKTNESIVDYSATGKGKTNESIVDYSTTGKGKTDESIVDYSTTGKGKTDDQICADGYGYNSYAVKNKSSEEGLTCDCKDGYIWNDSRTSCVVIASQKDLAFSQDINDDDTVVIGQYRCSSYEALQANLLSPTESEALITIAQKSLNQRLTNLEDLNFEIKISDVNEYSSQYEIDKYNLKVDEYNDGIALYKRDAASLSSRIDRYNSQVAAYNNYLINNCTKAY